LKYKLALGRIVLYKVRGDDGPQLNHNSPIELPAMVVAIFGSGSGDTHANLKIFTDGPGAPVWKTRVMLGDAPGTWHWPIVTS
jgi:hypothetical protein